MEEIGLEIGEIGLEIGEIGLKIYDRTSCWLPPLLLDDRLLSIWRFVLYNNNVNNAINQ